MKWLGTQNEESNEEKVRCLEKSILLNKNKITENYIWYYEWLEKTLCRY